jgi:Tfp pilus assembly protein PilF
VNEKLQPGDKLRTGLRSRATLRWSELSVVRLSELTSMEIQPPATDSNKNQLELRSGASYFLSREKPSSIEFRTPVASGAIRGTEFNLTVAEDGKTEVALLDGEVALSNQQGATTLSSGEQGTVEAGRAPSKTALINAANVIQWALYYPAVVDIDELGLGDTDVLRPSMEAYRQGDILGALGHYPETRVPASDPEKVLQAALLLAAGRVEQAQAAIKEVRGIPAVNAVQELIAAVKHESMLDLGEPTGASQWLARSYYWQSRGRLEEALKAARVAAEKAPRFGAAQIRVAELEFGFGHTDAAQAALTRGLELSPRNAEGWALNGFVLAARNRTAEAEASFNRAIEADGALANAWLGRGLIKIRRGLDVEGREDLQVAATLEPQRAVLRSYLGKSFADNNDLRHARKELDLAQKLDPNDPTSWLYSALLNQQANRINEAIENLEYSKELNENRSLFRSRLLLDQDQAVRGANLASIYRDAGMFDRSVQEAARAVNYDYGNYSAHLFLASSYDALRDPKLINLRYETPWFSELLVANLLQPVQGGNLSQNVSQQEYSKLFASDGFGVFSSTEYLSSGDWIQSGSQYGFFGNTSYSLDAYYRTEQGQRPNNDLEQLSLAGRFKQQITDKDSIFFQASYFDAESGDVAQYYDQHGQIAGAPHPSTTLRVTEKQEPNILLGYHREWSPGNHTLFLGGRFDDTLTMRDSDPALLFLGTAVSPFPPFNTNVFVQNPSFFSLRYQSELEAYSAELQQICEGPVFTSIVGVRFQSGNAETTDRLDRTPPLGETNQILIKNDTDLKRFSVYAYEHWQVFDPLRLIAGVTYDRLDYPANIDTSPINGREDRKDQLSPKAGFIYSPFQDTHLRGIYSRSLGGAFFDTSVRLEPTQIAGMTHAFRSLIPESVVGLVPGTRFETWGLGLDQSFKSGTYFVVQGEMLNSDASRIVGVLTNSDPTIPTPDSPSGTRQSLDYEEKSLLVSANQLIGTDWAVGARYRLTDSDLTTHFQNIDPAAFGAAALNQDVEATLHQVYLYAIYQHRCGFFAQFDSVWSQQSNRGYSPDIPGDDFWQFDFYLGYRFLQRRAEARVGILNLTDQDYRLNPLTLYNELPRERTLALSLKLNF